MYGESDLSILIGQIWFRIDAKNQWKLWKSLFSVTQHIVSLAYLLFKKHQTLYILLHFTFIYILEAT